MWTKRYLIHQLNHTTSVYKIKKKIVQEFVTILLLNETHKLVVILPPCCLKRELLMECIEWRRNSVNAQKDAWIIIKIYWNIDFIFNLDKNSFGFR